MASESKTKICVVEAKAKAKDFIIETKAKATTLCPYCTSKPRLVFEDAFFWSVFLSSCVCMCV